MFMYAFSGLIWINFVYVIFVFLEDKGLPEEVFLRKENRPSVGINRVTMLKGNQHAA